MPSDSRKRLSAPRAVTVNARSMREALEALPANKRKNRSEWDAEKDALLVEFWQSRRNRDVAKILGVCENSARERWRFLTEKGA